MVQWPWLVMNCVLDFEFVNDNEMDIWEGYILTGRYDYVKALHAAGQIVRAPDTREILLFRAF